MVAIRLSIFFSFSPSLHLPLPLSSQTLSFTHYMLLFALFVLLWGFFSLEKEFWPAVIECCLCFSLSLCVCVCQTLKNISWYTERALTEISLGSLLILVVIRTIQFNMTRTRVRLLHTLPKLFIFPTIRSDRNRRKQRKNGAGGRAREHIEAFEHPKFRFSVALHYSVLIFMNINLTFKFLVLEFAIYFFCGGGGLFSFWNSGRAYGSSTCEHKFWSFLCSCYFFSG